MIDQSYDDLSGAVKDIEEASEFKEIELKNELRLKLEAQARKRIIFIWFPVVGLGLVILIWLIVNIPNYDGCVRDCIGKAREVNTQSKDDCQFYCNVKFGN